LEAGIMKRFGAFVVCSICSAQPWPTDAAIRETFSLLRLGPDGRPAETPSKGEWRCEEHPIARQDLPAERAPRASPIEALTNFENLLTAESARLSEEVVTGHPDDAVTALASFQQEVGRGFAELRKAVQP
jgi:hypothetical protein